MAVFKSAQPQACSCFSGRQQLMHPEVLEFKKMLLDEWKWYRYAPARKARLRLMQLGEKARFDLSVRESLSCLLNNPQDKEERICSFRAKRLVADAVAINFIPEIIRKYASLFSTAVSSIGRGKGFLESAGLFFKGLAWFASEVSGIPSVIRFLKSLQLAFKAPCAEAVSSAGRKLFSAVFDVAFAVATCMALAEVWQHTRSLAAATFSGAAASVLKDLFKAAVYAYFKLNLSLVKKAEAVGARPNQRQ